MDDREPTLRELTAIVKAQEKRFFDKLADFEKLMSERSERYKESFQNLTTNQTSALASLEKQTKLAFDASEKAGDKNETAQREYNLRSNEFRAALDDANKHMMPRPEAESLVRGLREMIDRLRDEQIKGLDAAKTEARKDVESAKSEIAGLRESRSQMAGHQEQRTQSVGMVQWAVPIALGTGLTLLGLAINVAIFFATRGIPVVR